METVQREHERAKPIPNTTELRPAVFVSASVPDGVKVYPGCERHRETARPQWIRDAVLGLARELLGRDFDLLFGAHPAISPMLLTVSREFPEKAPPRITVFQSEHFIDKFPPETLELADGHLGQLVITPSRLGDNPRESSLALMRQMMFERTGLVAAVFVGGMDGIIDEAVLFKRLNPSLPTYAVGSAGGAARDLLLKPEPPYCREDFCGGPVAPVDLALLQEERAGYVRVSRAVRQAIQGALDSGKIQLRG